MSITADTLLKIEKGNVEPEELAAITAILLARAAATPEETAVPAPRQAGWRRLERTPGFRAPHSWR
ncbi:acyl-CoA carboxylase subunit epsilon [Streptomyces sp. NBC_01233]|uniref:acyl-CoA carboxylase subunit epsilon n=1 Tax=Streptomyces sp. NBC_01233 TaxID=2903787 RepID=UPI002E0D95BE|nr:acyl-CoA carboxylase subunit epsilon [Streptomyces sp. NBC_01233]